MKFQIHSIIRVSSRQTQLAGIVLLVVLATTLSSSAEDIGKTLNRVFSKSVRDTEKAFKDNTWFDAAIHWTASENKGGIETIVANRAYFFQGHNYMRYNLWVDEQDQGLKNITAGWEWPDDSRWNNGIDAALCWNKRQIAYLFKDHYYLRYNMRTNKIEGNQPITRGWAGNVPWDDGVDAAVYWRDDRAMFFSGSRYWSYDLANDTCSSVYPISRIFPNIPSSFSSDIDSALNGGNGKLYLFKGDQYVRIDVGQTTSVSTLSVDAGYPKSITSGWGVNEGVGSKKSAFQNFAKDVSSQLTEGLNPLQKFKDEAERLRNGELRELVNLTQTAIGVKDDFNRLIAAVKRQDTKAVTGEVIRLAKNRGPLANLIEAAEKKEMGSLMFCVTGDSSAAFTAGGGFGYAYNLQSLSNLINGKSTDVNGAFFVTGGVAMGASGGLSGDFQVGWDTSTPDEVGGPSLDVNLEVKAAAGGGISMGFEPSEDFLKAPQFSGFMVGVGGGANFRADVGGSWTEVVYTF